MIKVLDKWVIDADGKQFVAGKLASRVNKDGQTEEYIKDPMYHTTFAGCVQAISKRMRLEAIRNTDGDMEAAIEAIKKADARLMKAIGKFDDIEVVQKKK